MVLILQHKVRRVGRPRALFMLSIASLPSLSAPLLLLALLLWLSPVLARHRLAPNADFCSFNVALILCFLRLHLLALPAAHLPSLPQFQQAANQFKIEKNWDSSGRAFDKYVALPHRFACCGSGRRAVLEEGRPSSCVAGVGRPPSQGGLRLARPGGRSRASKSRAKVTEMGSWTSQYGSRDSCSQAQRLTILPLSALRLREAEARLKANEKDDAIQAFWNASKSSVPLLNLFSRKKLTPRLHVSQVQEVDIPVCHPRRRQLAHPRRHPPHRAGPLPPGRRPPEGGRKHPQGDGPACRARCV